MNTYIRGCRTFSDAINNLRFELSVPEYYDTMIPNYFRKPMEPAKPIVNGVEVEWDEYLETHPDEKPTTFIPRPIYRSEDLNRSYASKSSAEIVDLVVNDVPFEFIHFEDIELVINILDGYYDEVKNYIPYNNNLKMFVDNMENARFRLKTVYDEATNYQNNVNPNRNKGPMSLVDILNRMKRG